jgi:hypothetical protein
MNLRQALLKVARVVPLIVGVGWSAVALAQSSAPAPQPALDPTADKILARACQTLGAADAFSFHADLMFDQVLPGAVKVQYGGAMDYAVQRPGELAIVYRSDLGGKDLWYGNGSLTLFDPKYGMYATTAVPSTIDAMLNQVAEQQGLAMPLSDLVYSNPCARPKKIAVTQRYLGVSSVQGVPCDHPALSSSMDDSRPRSSSTIAASRDRPNTSRFCRLEIPKDIATSRFQPQLPKDAKQIAFMKAEEAKP